MAKDWALAGEGSTAPDVGKVSRLEERSALFLWLATWCMGGAAIGGFLTTYIGTKAILDWLAGPHFAVNAIALMVSFLATTLNFVLFAGTFRLLPLFQTWAAKVLGLGVLATLMLLSLSALTSTSIIGMTGTSARALYLAEEARRHGLNVYELSERTLKQREFADFVGPDAEASCDTAAEEVRTGRLSGSPGQGRVSDSLGAICTRKRAIDVILAENMAESAPLIHEITELSRKLDTTVIDRTLTIEDRELAFIDAARHLEARLLELRAADRMNAVRASYQQMEDALAGLEGDQSSLTPGQQGAMRTLIAREKASAKAVRHYIAKIEARALPPLHRSELVPMPRLVVRFAEDHWPQIALALLVDFFGPLVTVLIWAAAMRRRENLNKIKRYRE